MSALLGAAKIKLWNLYLFQLKTDYVLVKLLTCFQNNLFCLSHFLVTNRPYCLVKLVGSEEKRQSTDTEVRAAVWEVCGDSGALQLLVDLLQTK